MANAETVTVRVAEGLLRGMRVDSQVEGASYWSFQGVPYAIPPVGPLRFKDAQPMVPWEGVRDTLAPGGMSVHFDPNTHEIVGSDDCLYLNVFTPQRPGPGMVPQPVMVFIHGGGFEFGCGNADMFGPDFLVREDVVVVTINYRLGVLGFLFLDEAAPGNVGLKDQVAVLRWVQRNIAAFGGDPGNVTLFGFSAGATSTHMHMLSPMSKGLFHRAISMSGAALNPWAVQTEPARTTRRLARLLGCTSDDPHAIVDFLRRVDHKELLRAARTEAVPEKDKKRLVTFGIVPTAEVHVPGVEMFLPAPAEQLMKEGRHHAIPYMTGIVENEGYLALMFVDILNESVAKKWDANWEDSVLPELRLRADNPKNKDALNEIRRFFFGGKPLSGDTLQKNVDLFSDLTINEGVYYALRCMEKFPKASLYQYLFSFDGEFNLFKCWKKIAARGAAHADDLGYLFTSEFTAPDTAEDSPSAIARRRMVRLWTNFAKTGNPTPKYDPLLGVQWTPYTATKRNFLEIGSELRMGKDLYADRVAFWEKLYDTYG